MFSAIRRTSSLIRLVLLTTLLAGCIPYSDFPLTAPETARDDPAIIGDWYAEENGERSIFRISKGEQTGTILVTSEKTDGQDPGELSRLRGHLSIIDGRRYMNILSDDPDEEIPGYMFVRYSVDDGRLGIAINDPDRLFEFVETGRLEGEVIRHEWSRSLHITASIEKLRRFVSEHDAEIFMETRYLERLTDKTPPPEKRQPVR